MSKNKSTFRSWLEEIFRFFGFSSERKSATEPLIAKQAKNKRTVSAQEHLRQKASDSEPSNGKKAITKSPHKQGKTRITLQADNKDKTRITQQPGISRIGLMHISGPGVIQGTGELSFGDTLIGAVSSDQAQSQIIIKGDFSVSGSHAQIWLSLEGITLENLSRFGTGVWVKQKQAGSPLNYQHLSSRGDTIRLSVGSKIKIGNTVFEVTTLDRNSHPSQPDSASIRSWNPETNRAGAYRLSVEEGPDLGQEFVINQLPATLGRAANCAICLDKDLSVSGQHAELYQKGKMLRLRDLDSRSGTNLNGYDIEDEEIKPGHKIRLGNSLLVLKNERRGP